MASVIYGLPLTLTYIRASYVYLLFTSFAPGVSCVIYYIIIVQKNTTKNL